MRPRTFYMITATMLAGILALLALGGLGLAQASPVRQKASAPLPCQYGVTCVTGKLLVRDPGSDTPHQLLVEDKSGAPMFWVDYGGAWSGGEPVCVVSLHLERLACLGGYDYGGQAVVTLYAHGRAYSLTAGDITWIHAHGG